ncbi:DUF6798 domain-containing protein [Planctomicrobium sp. SH664]|uniref:DUF6798 domain-containing protein n=1 Tax=Planctomicrobium sp. SH664 TaxID=3448125 RepID=UPI003F5C55F7
MSSRSLCRGRTDLLSGVGIWFGLIAWSLWRVPIPGINEPHYLSKARHFWDPTWCSGDFFLDSSNPHFVFYLTFGLLTQFLSLPQAACVGRILGLLMVALGWDRLARAVTGQRLAGLVSLPLFLLLQTWGNWSGEWLVGGIEAKVPAYGCLFWGIGSWLQGSRRSAAVALGLAVSFHPIVGVWGTVGTVAAELGCWFRRGKIQGAEDAPIDFRQQVFVPALLYVVSAAPGLIPALAALGASSPQVNDAATQLIVGSRLKHHLDPMEFHRGDWWYFGVQCLAWSWLQWMWFRRNQQVAGDSASTDFHQRWWTAFVLTTLLVACVGLVIGIGPRPLSHMPGFLWRAALLKFYPFRLADLAVPLALSLIAAQWMLRWAALSPARKPVLFLSLAAIFLASLFYSRIDRNPHRSHPGREVSFRESCLWLKKNSAATDLVYATDRRLAVKWYAERPEYVSYKDCPQDADSIIEWNRRLWVIADWTTAASADGSITTSELEDLRRQTGIRYWIPGDLASYLPDEVFRNDSGVVELPDRLVPAGH